MIELREMLTSVRNNQTRNVTQALVVFLLKLRSGNSNKMIAEILELEREQLVFDYTASIMNSFTIKKMSYPPDLDFVYL